MNLRYVVVSEKVLTSRPDVV